MLSLRLSVASLAFLVAFGFGAAETASAQDPFEIQVYEYETVPKGRWNLETHFNYTAEGTRVAEGPVAPTNHQSHLTFELTRGITDVFEMAGYLVFADRPGAGAELAGWRLRPRIRAPDSWKLPVKLSLSTEFGFPRDTYEENSVTFELRPIIERKFGRVQVDVNPTLGRALSGPGTGEGWDFEPGGRDTAQQDAHGGLLCRKHIDACDQLERGERSSCRGAGDARFGSDGVVGRGWKNAG